MRERGLAGRRHPTSSSCAAEALRGSPAGGSSRSPKNRTSCSSSTPNSVERAPSRFRHQRERVRGAGLARVLDEVRMARGDLGAADPLALEPQASSMRPARELVLGVLEDAPEGALVRRLRGLSLRLEVGDGGLDLLGGLWHEAELRARHTSPARASERRYSRPSSSGARQPAPSAVTTSARSRMPPSLPRTRPRSSARRRRPSPESRRRTRSRRARPRASRWRQTAFVAPPPATSSSPSTSAAASSPSSRSASPSTPPSATRGSSRARRCRRRALRRRPSGARPRAPQPTADVRSAAPARRSRPSSAARAGRFPRSSPELAQ